MLGSMKTTEVEYVRGWTMNDYHHLESGLLQVALEQKTGIETFEELMTALSGCFRGPITNSVKNVFSNGPLKNEATPGNITLESTPNGVRVLWHDIDGLGHEVATFDNAAPPK